MRSRPLSVLCAALAMTCASAACAQSTPGQPAAAQTAPAAAVPRPADNRFEPMVDPALPRIDEAIRQAELGRHDASGHGDIAAHPLYRWVEYAALKRDIDTLPPARAQAFLQRYQGDAVAAEFRQAWLTATARREDAAAFLAAWDDGIDDIRLRCGKLDAQRRLGRTGAEWTREAQDIWRGSGESRPDQCDPVFAALADAGHLPPALSWERIEKAAAEWQPGVMRVAARNLPPAERALAEDYAAFIDSPHPRALEWPKTDRSRLVASHGLAKLGKDDPDRAESLLPQYARALGFSEADRGRAMYRIALWSVASYLPDSERRLNLVPESSYDERLHEWRVREALSRSDWPAALAAIRKMGPDQRNDSRYAYFEARLAELTGDAATAQAKYRAAALVPEFHGFLAADRIDQPYALCPREPSADAALRASVSANPALRRAMGLHQLGRAGWAVKEWHDAMDDFDDSRRHLAVEMAQANGWYDRAVFSLGRGKPEELRFYSLRFPLSHDAVIRREAARNNIDPAWVAAEIRAESIFNPKARSGANALGLMQVLPATGASVARRIGEPWGGAASLYQPETNIVLGTAYLRQMMDEYGGKPYFAIAGYNAGPTPLQRWQSQRPGMDADFWIETISYKETREYVARVFAFSVIYDWRLDGDALRLSDRMEGRTQGPRKQFRCPASPAA